MEKELSNMEIALFALYKLGGIGKKIHTEKIAWEAYNLAKERFSWRLPEFREKGFPDKTPVRFALEQAKKEENGSLVSGRAGGDIGGKELEGWKLTPEGVTWIKKNEIRIAEGLGQRTSDAPRRQAERFIKRIKKESLFNYFLEKKTLDDASRYAFTDVLICAPDASKEIIEQKFSQVLANATLVGDEEILKFLQACKEKFILKRGEEVRDENRSSY